MFYFNTLKLKSMKTYCLVCRKNTDNINSKMVKTKNSKVLRPQCSICGNKKTRFI